MLLKAKLSFVNLVQVRWSMIDIFAILSALFLHFHEAEQTIIARYISNDEI